METITSSRKVPGLVSSNAGIATAAHFIYALIVVSSMHITEGMAVISTSLSEEENKQAKR